MFAAKWWPLTSCLFGERSTKLSGLAMRNMNDSTLNCDPRLSTEKKSTPNTRANSLEDASIISQSSHEKINLYVRGLRHNISSVYDFQHHRCTSLKVA